MTFSSRKAFPLGPLLRGYADAGIGATLPGHSGALLTEDVGGSLRELGRIFPVPPDKRAESLHGRDETERLGVVGAFAGGWLFRLFGASGVSGLNLYSLFVAVIGSVVFLVLYHALRRRRAW